MASGPVLALPKGRRMSQRDERRRLTRIRTAIAAVLTGADGAAIHARLENLSLIGLNAAADRAPDRKSTRLNSSH